MSTSSLTALADGVVTRLSSQSLSKSFSVSRNYLPDFDREELSGVEISVFPNGMQASTVSRSKEQFIYTLNIVVRIPITPSASPDISSELYFVQEVRDALRLISIGTAGYQGIQNDPAYDLEALAERNEFVAVLTSTYLEIK